LATSAGIFVGVSRSQDIIDWWKLRDYQPSVAIENLSVDAGFNDVGEKLFYVNDPTLLSKELFAQKCSVDEVTIVLGCYISSQNIYLFDVEDERLEGVEEVTAAHEMLHAAFERLSPSEQDDIEKLLVAAFNDLDNERIKKTVRSYESRDKSIIPNELHSIMGTEVRDLPGPLKEYYDKYFEDRLKVVDLAERYADEFEKREALIESFDDRLEVLQSDIVRLESGVTLQGEALGRERQLLSNLESNPEAYNRAVGSYNSLVNVYNADVNSLKGLVEAFNSIVAERNEIALEERQLVEAIDTRIEQL